jgi:signal transduction histidine kinase/NAD-dependent dihydropyrimidine dehydrogenase PreA subunit
MAITERHGSWVVLGALVTDVDVDRSPPLRLDCGECRLCVDACPTGALDDPGTLDANRCLSYWTQAPAPVPEEYRAELGSSVYGCDICQEVCPWNRGIEKRRAGLPMPDDAVANASLLDWLTGDGAALVAELDRLYVPRTTVAGYAATRSSRPATPRDRRSGRASRRTSRRKIRSWPRLRPGRSGDWRRAVMPEDLGSERFAMLVHEVRSPVAALWAIAETVGQPNLDLQARADLVRLAVAACRGIERIVADGVVSVRLEAVDLSTLVTDAVAAARLGGAVVESEIAAEIPRVDADPSRLRQVLDNLLANAVTHGGGAGVVVSAIGCGDMVRIAVADQGPGVRAAEQRRVFERACASTRVPGSGLGLAVTRAVVEAHGGRLDVSSSEGAVRRSPSSFRSPPPLAGNQVSTKSAQRRPLAACSNGEGRRERSRSTSGRRAPEVPRRRDKPRRTHASTTYLARRPGSIQANASGFGARCMQGRASGRGGDRAAVGHTLSRTSSRSATAAPSHATTARPRCGRRRSCR